MPCFAKYRSIIKIPKSRQLTNSCKIKVEMFKNESKHLFDLAACKCDFTQCKCDKYHRVPVQEQPFLADQRGQQKMCIGSIDNQTTKKLKRRFRRRLRVEVKLRMMNCLQSKPQYYPHSSNHLTQLRIQIQTLIILHIN